MVIIDGVIGAQVDTDPDMHKCRYTDLQRCDAVESMHVLTENEHNRPGTKGNRAYRTDHMRTLCKNKISAACLAAFHLPQQEVASIVRL